MHTTNKGWKRLLVGALGLFLAAAAQARGYDEIRKAGKIVIASEGQYAPFNHFENNKLTGFEIELAELVAKKMGLAVEWKALGFDALLAGLNQGRWDLVIASHGVTQERARAVTFTEPHYCSGGIVVSKNPALRAAKDLAGKSVAVQTGSSYMQQLSKLPGLKEVKNFPQDTDARTAMLSGRLDAWVTDRFVAKAAAKSQPAAGLQVGELIFVERIAAAVGKGNTPLAQAYNQALREVFADGSYAALSQRYFGEDVRCK
ncbi:ABC transporter substrate-binding protein [Aquabacterium sp. A7-Y]|uniref:ABC transporter substrate-binding protein n=1 Tax=Aquabacterium sp. A7-Y TaxID=1349605 RepID=UPI00223DA2D1|nr:ABC transporter substrate-binding protein [Aquabacterium sp. A7-Y]MCW7539756.1 ABC transporter substrate-binding protein [Aquabacterium sp. A7-Y]